MRSEGPPQSEEGRFRRLADLQRNARAAAGIEHVITPDQEPQAEPPAQEHSVHAQIETAGTIEEIAEALRLRNRSRRDQEEKAPKSPSALKPKDGGEGPKMRVRNIDTVKGVSRRSQESEPMSPPPGTPEPPRVDDEKRKQAVSDHGEDRPEDSEKIERHEKFLLGVLGGRRVRRGLTPQELECQDALEYAKLFTPNFSFSSESLKFLERTYADMDPDSHDAKKLALAIRLLNEEEKLPDEPEETEHTEPGAETERTKNSRAHYEEIEERLRAGRKDKIGEKSFAVLLDEMIEAMSDKLVESSDEQESKGWERSIEILKEAKKLSPAEALEKIRDAIVEDDINIEIDQMAKLEAASEGDMPRIPAEPAAAPSGHVGSGRAEQTPKQRANRESFERFDALVKQMIGESERERAGLGDTDQDENRRSDLDLRLRHLDELIQEKNLEKMAETLQKAHEEKSVTDTEYEALKKELFSNVFETVVKPGFEIVAKLLGLDVKKLIKAFPKLTDASLDALVNTATREKAVIDIKACINTMLESITEAIPELAEIKKDPEKFKQTKEEMFAIFDEKDPAQRKIKIDAFIEKWKLVGNLAEVTRKTTEAIGALNTLLKGPVTPEQAQAAKEEAKESSRNLSSTWEKGWQIAGLVGLLLVLALVMALVLIVEGANAIIKKGGKGK